MDIGLKSRAYRHLVNPDIIFRPPRLPGRQILLMSILNSGLAKNIGIKARALPLFRRAGRLVDNVRRRLLRKPRTVTESPNLLPLLIQVLAAFSKSGAEVMEE